MEKNRSRGLFRYERGYFYRASEVSRSARKAFDSVGTVLDEYYQRVGTCFLVDRDDGKFLLTARHCFSLDRTGEGPLTTSLNASFNGVRVSLDPSDVIPQPWALEGADYFIARVQGMERFPGLTLSSRSIPELLNRQRLVRTIGYPGAYLQKYSLEGPLMSVGILDTIMDGLDLEARLRIHPGSSGSPILDERSEVIGIVTKSTLSGVYGKRRIGRMNNWDLEARPKRTNVIAFAFPTRLLEEQNCFGR